MYNPKLSKQDTFLRQETFGQAFTYAKPRGLFSDSNGSDGDSALARQPNPGWPCTRAASRRSLRLGISFQGSAHLCALPASWPV